MTPRIVPQPIGGSRLVTDYLAGAGSAASFFHGRPSDPAAFQSKLRAVQARFDRAARERVARAVVPTSDRARARLERFVREGGAVVTTGQQAGLFTGPLYTIHKALTAVRLAERLEAALGVVVLPVFWIASEDHDWAEVNHAFVHGAAGGLRRIGWPAPAQPSAVPMHAWTLGADVTLVVDELAQVVGDGGYAESYLTSIRGAYAPGQTMAGAFGRLLGELLAGFDLLVTDAGHAEVKAGSREVLRRALQGAREQEEVLRLRTRQLEAEGYHGQVAVLEEATNVFYQGPAGRERVYRAAGGYRLAGAGGVREAAELEAELDRHPERFSPNVLLRPVAESAVFPTLAYVGGPGEIAYFAQLTALFPEFGMEPPIVYPRSSVSIVERPIGRLLEKLGLTLAELRRPRHELRAELARELVPRRVTEALERLRHEVAAQYARLIDAAVEIDPGLSGPLGAARNAALAGVESGERKVLARVQAKEATRLQQLDRALEALWPQGQPQDRVLNVVPFLARHGPALLGEIAAALELAPWEDASPAPVARSALGGSP